MEWGEKEKRIAVTVLHNVIETKQNGDLLPANPKHSQIFSEVIEGPYPLRHREDDKEKYDEDKNALEDKKIKTKIPVAKSKQVTSKVTEKSCRKDEDEAPPSHIPRRSSIPILKDSNIPQRIDKEKKEIKGDVKEKDKDTIKDKEIKTEEEFEKLFEEIVDGNEEINVQNILKSPIGDPVIVENSFEEIVHDYEEKKVHPLDIDKTEDDKAKHSKIPLLKRRSEQEINIPKPTERRNSLKTYVDRSRSGIPRARDLRRRYSTDVKHIENVQKKQNIKPIKVTNEKHHPPTVCITNNVEIVDKVSPQTKVDNKKNDNTRLLDKEIQPVDFVEKNDEIFQENVSVPAVEVTETVQEETLGPIMHIISDPKNIVDLNKNREDDKEELQTKSDPKPTEILTSEIADNNIVAETVNKTGYQEPPPTSIILDKNPLYYTNTHEIELSNKKVENMIFVKQNSEEIMDDKTLEHTETPTHKGSVSKLNAIEEAQKEPLNEVKKSIVNELEEKSLKSDPKKEAANGVPKKRSILAKIAMFEHPQPKENLCKPKKIVTKKELVKPLKENTLRVENETAESTSRKLKIIDHVLKPMKREMNTEDHRIKTEFPNDNLINQITIEENTDTIDEKAEILNNSKEQLVVSDAEDVEHVNCNKPGNDMQNTDTNNTTSEVSKVKEPEHITESEITGTEVADHAFGSRLIIDNNMNNVENNYEINVEENVPHESGPIDVEQVNSNEQDHDTQYPATNKTTTGEVIEIKSDTETKVIKTEIMDFGSDPIARNEMINSKTNDETTVNENVNYKEHDQNILVSNIETENTDLNALATREENRRKDSKIKERKKSDKEETYNNRKHMNDKEVISNLQFSNEGLNIRRTKSVAELDLGDSVVGIVNKMIFRINSVETLEHERKEVINIKERPKKNCVLERIALFEKKFTPVKAQTCDSLCSPAPLPETTTFPTTTTKILSDEKYEERISELANAKEKYGRFDNMTYVKLNNDVEMPSIIVGTALLHTSLIKPVISAAIDLGYRGFDSAFLYGNEALVGEAIRAKIEDGTVTREELFIVNKLWSTFHDPALVETGCTNSLKKMGLEYFDLFLIHNPMSLKEGPDPFPKIAKVLQFSRFEYLDAWFGMENVYAKGLARSIGVSNFNSVQVGKIVDKGKVKPVINEVECHPYLTQIDLDNYCSNYDIKLNCFGVLGSKGTPPEWKAHQTPVIDDIVVKQMAEAMNITPAQLLLRYQFERGHTAVVKSTQAHHLWDNLQALTMSLTTEQVKSLNKLNKNKRTYTLMGLGETHKNYPFNIPF